MKDKLFGSKQASKTLRTFIEKEYCADANAVWNKTIEQDGLLVSRTRGVYK